MNKVIKSVFIIAGLIFSQLPSLASASLATNITNNVAPTATVHRGDTNVLVMDVKIPDAWNGSSFTADTVVDTDGISSGQGSTTNGSGSFTAIYQGAPLVPFGAVDIVDSQSPSGLVSLCAKSLIPPFNIGEQVFISNDTTCTSGAMSFILGSGPLFGPMSNVNNTWAFSDANSDGKYQAGEDIFYDNGTAGGSASNGVFDRRDDKLTGLGVQNIGTAVNSTDISAVHAWVDDGDNIFNAGSDTDLGLMTVTSNNQKWNLSGLTTAIPNGGLRIFITANITPTATNVRTLNFEIPVYVDSGSDGIVNGDDVGVFVASTNDGPTDTAVVNGSVQTIRHTTSSYVEPDVTPVDTTSTTTTNTATINILNIPNTTHASVLINNGEAGAPSSNVILTLFSQGATQMMIANNNSFLGASWVPFTQKKSWTLSAGDGVQTVYVKFKNSLGVGSATVSDNINVLTVNSLAKSSVLVPSKSFKFVAVSSIKDITINLGLGSKGKAVMALQDFLIHQDKGLEARALSKVGKNGNFGKLTKAAMIEWQNVVGIIPASGYFGPKTRAYLSNSLH
ncbi:MAG: hypothetical protein V4439_03965 [Patescibacteria group bacterium]